MQSRLFRGLLAGSVLGLTLSVAAPSAVQAQMQFGVAGSYADSYDFGVGGFVKFNLTELNGKAVTGRGSFDYYFPSYGGAFTGNVNFHAWEASLDGLYSLNTSSSKIKPYVGAGARITKTTFSYDGDDDACDFYDCGSSDFGLNLIGGIDLSGKMAPFAEAKYELGNGGQFVIKFGIHFGGN